MSISPDVAAIIAAFSDDRRTYACVDRNWAQAFAGLDLAWRGSVQGCFGINCKEAPVRHPLGLRLMSFNSWRETYLAWRTLELQMCGETIRFGEIWLRMTSAMDKIHTFHTHMANHPRFAATTPLPVDYSKIPDLMQLIRKEFRYNTNHQRHEEEANCQEIQAFLANSNGYHGEPAGIGGMTVFYDRFRTVFPVPLSESLTMLKNSQENGTSNYFLFAQAVNEQGRNEAIFLHSSGKVIRHFYQGQRDSQGRVQWVTLFQTGPSIDHCLLQFYETLAEDLTHHERRVVQSNSFKFFSSFPLKGPRTSIETTQGLTVRASYTYVPDLQRPIYAFQFAISFNPRAPRDWNGKIRLIYRHWCFSDVSTGDVNYVNGPGVIGLTPTFDSETGKCDQAKDGINFVYESCAIASPGTTMEGSLSFETLNDPPIRYRILMGKLTFQVPRFAF